MYLPKTITVSSKTQHIIFGDATPSELKSKGTYFNQGELTTVDNLVTDINIINMSGATSRGSSNVYVSLEATLGRGTNKVTHRFDISGEDFLELIDGINIHNKIIEGEFVLLFYGKLFKLKQNKQETLSQIEGIISSRKNKQKKVNNQQKEIRQKNREMVKDLEIGQVIRLGDATSIFLGHKYITYYNKSRDMYVTKKGIVIMYYGRDSYPRHYRNIEIGLLSDGEVLITGVEDAKVDVAEIFNLNQAELVKQYRGLSSGYNIELHRSRHSVCGTLYVNATISSISNTKDESLNMYRTYRNMIQDTYRGITDMVWGLIEPIHTLKYRNPRNISHEPLA